MNPPLQPWVLSAALLAPFTISACRCDAPPSKSDAASAALAQEASLAPCRPQLLPAHPRVDWRGIRGEVDLVTRHAGAGGCDVYDVRVTPKPLRCAASYVSGDADGSVGQDATEPQTLRVHLPMGLKLPVVKGDEVCGMYDWVDDGKTRVWDSVVVAKDGRVLMLAVENGALDVGGFHAKPGIAEGADLQNEFYRVILEHPGGRTELRPRVPVTKAISGVPHYLVGEAFARRAERAGGRDRGFFYSVVRLAP